MTSEEPDFRYWWTLEEWSRDHRTGATAVIRERARRSSDRPGKEDTVWNWVVSGNGSRVEGHAQNQKGARQAVRKFVRTLPDRST